MGTDPDSEVMADVQPGAAKVSDAYVTFYEGLAQATWPANVQPAIDDLIEQVTTEASMYRSLAEATTGPAFTETYNAIVDSATSSNPAAVVRAKLGLESNVNGEPETCP